MDIRPPVRPSIRLPACLSTVHFAHGFVDYLPSNATTIIFKLLFLLAFEQVTALRWQTKCRCWKSELVKTLKNTMLFLE